uniref:Nitrogenase cofactor biosynthesis protein NifB n=1 Tax=Paenibacillus polymyxa TaxID=1406 RepID=A0AAE9TIN8_PAEPO
MDSLADLSETPLALETLRRHPCYNEEAHRYFARIHLPVAPACNIQCHYCNRKFDCVNESRPGVVSELLTPEQAASKTYGVAAQLMQLSVVGIAGPGDPLANAEATFDTFRRVRETVKDVIFCLSTNGLTLIRHIDRIVELGISHVTITINAVDPVVGSRIYGWVYDEGKRYAGEEAARLLIDRQLAGLKMLASRGVLCKVNSVLIPEVNDAHLPEVARVVKEHGAVLHNIMPLIIAPGSRYEQEGMRAPVPVWSGSCRSNVLRRELSLCAIAVSAGRMQLDCWARIAIRILHGRTLWLLLPWMKRQGHNFRKNWMRR